MNTAHSTSTQATGQLAPVRGSVRIWRELPLANRIWITATRVPGWLYAALAVAAASVLSSALLASANTVLAILALLPLIPVSLGTTFMVDRLLDGPGLFGPDDLEAALLEMGAHRPRTYLRRHSDRKFAFHCLSDLLDGFVSGRDRFHAALLAFSAPDPDALRKTLPRLVREQEITNYADLLRLIEAEGWTPDLPPLRPAARRFRVGEEPLDPEQERDAERHARFATMHTGTKATGRS